MKNRFILLILLVSNIVTSVKAKAQAEEAQQLLLDVEKFTQLRQILQDLKTGYEIISSGYNTIKNISEGNFNLHQEFLNSLLEVSPAVRKYKRIQEIISCQLQIVKEHKSAYHSFKASDHFSASELEYIESVYGSLLKQSLKNLDALALVLTTGRLRMSDDERLQAIDNIWENMQEQQSFLQYFNNQSRILALQRERENSDVNTIKTLYGITK
jgi:hypothetical protein